MCTVTTRTLAVLRLALLFVWCIPGGPSAAHGGEEPPSKAAEQFETRVAPLLAKHCLECHGPTSKKGGLDLSRKAAAFAGGKNGSAVVPGKPTDSLLWEHVESGRMPPRSRPRLSSEDHQALRDWIAGGAVWPVGTADISLFVKDRDAASAWVRRLTVPEYIETVRAAVDVNVEHEARELLPREVRADGFGNTAYNLTVDLGHVEAYAKLAEITVRRMDVAAFAARFSKERDLTDAHLRRLVAAMGKWVLRGPLTDHEVDAFLRVANAVKKEGGDHTEAVRYVVEAMLQSSRFVYRIEDRPGGHVLASRMSYILWGAPPDEELVRVADAGELADRAKVEAQVRRMLRDPRAVKQSRRFVAEWLDLNRLDALRPDPMRFPRWDPQLAADMREETLAFFEEVAWRQDRPLPELMNAQVTFLTPRLADHYGLKRTVAARPGDSPPACLVGRATRDLLVLYTFEEGSGDTVRDVSGAGQPLHLKIEKSSAVRWGGGRLTVTGTTVIATADSPTRLTNAVKRSKEVTLEAWVTPANTSQKGPARILTLSLGPNQRNFTLGQDESKYDVRFRTTKTDANGTPSLTGPTNILYTRPTHVAFTRDAAGKSRLYIDGEEKAARAVAGDVSNWDGTYRLALANETTGDRPWKGTYHLVAVYSRALTPDEVRGNARGVARYDLSAVPARGGLLTHGSVLTVGGDDASTVTRGLFVLRELLYSGVDDPPPCVDTIPVPAKPGQSRRAVAMQRITNKACAGCHARFETIALGLEKFDGVGGHREKDEHGNALRDDGEIQFPDNDKPTRFRSSTELMDLLAESERVGRGITRKVTQFALGRPLTVADEPAVEAIHAAARKGGGNIRQPHHRGCDERPRAEGPRLDRTHSPVEGE